MGMYTKLYGEVELKLDENVNNFINILNALDDVYYRHWNIELERLADKNKDNELLRDLILDERWSLLQSNIEYLIVDDIVKLRVNAEIKNYTCTYEKFIDVLNSFELLSGKVEYEYETWSSSDVYEVKNNRLILTENAILGDE